MSLHGRLAIASTSGEDRLPLREYEGEWVEIYDAVEWLPMVGVQGGAGYVLIRDRIEVVLGVDVGAIWQDWSVRGSG